MLPRNSRKRLISCSEKFLLKKVKRQDLLLCEAVFAFRLTEVAFKLLIIWYKCYGKSSIQRLLELALAARGDKKLGSRNLGARSRTLYLNTTIWVYSCRKWLIPHLCAMCALSSDRRTIKIGQRHAKMEACQPVTLNFPGCADGRMVLFIFSPSPTAKEAATLETPRWSHQILPSCSCLFPSTGWFFRIYTNNLLKKSSATA